MNLNHSLRIKYGLQIAPTDQQVKQWLHLVDKLIQVGMDKESAGTSAAKQVFPDFNSVLLLSEADTIETLLEAARKKVESKEKKKKKTVSRGRG